MNTDGPYERMQFNRALVRLNLTNPDGHQLPFGPVLYTTWIGRKTERKCRN